MEDNLKNFAVGIQPIENGFIVSGRKEANVVAGFAYFVPSYAAALSEVRARLLDAVEYINSQLKPIPVEVDVPNT